MAGSVNKVILIGNLGADPEIRRTQSGDPVASFRIATSETWRDKNSGERRERTEWHSVVVWNEHLVEVVEKYLRKGMKVYVEGQLQTRKWQGQDGIDRYTTEVVLNRFRGEMQMLQSSGAGRPGMPDSPDDYGSMKSGERGGDFGRDAQAGNRSVSDTIREGYDSNASRDLDDEIRSDGAIPFDGPPEASARRADILDRIRANVAIDPVTGCWIWQGTTSGEGRGGYPRMKLGGQTCRNRMCVNPATWTSSRTGKTASGATAREWRIEA